MPWIEYHLQISANEAERLSDELNELGAEALTFSDAGDQPIFEPDFKNPSPLWPKTNLVALFPEEHDAQSIEYFLKKKIAEGIIKNYSTKKIQDEDWERRCLEDFKPLKFGKRLWICPSWELPPDKDAVNIILDPGLAFGTGTHPTTALCLEWLDENFRPGMSVIDYGCGSGILAIAACKLGARSVLAVDHDPQALYATAENAGRNHLAQPQLSTHLPANFSPEPVDLLIANILTNPLLELAPLFAKLVKPSGKIVLSGILNNQIDLIKDKYANYFLMEVPVFKQDWVRFVGQKNIC